MRETSVRVAISRPLPPKPGPPYLVSPAHSHHNMLCILYIVPILPHFPLYIVSQPVFCAFPAKPQHFVSTPIQPLYLVLCIYYIQHNPISCIYYYYTTTISTICCTCAFPPLRPFRLSTIYCVCVYVYTTTSCTTTTYCALVYFTTIYCSYLCTVILLHYYTVVLYPFRLRCCNAVLL